MVGYEAGRNTTTGGDNTFVGRSSGRTNSAGYQNTFVGSRSGYSNSIGNQNTFMGFDAGDLNGSGSQNTFVGRNAGKQNISGNENTFIGNQAGQQNSTGSQNTYVGEDAAALGTFGYSNVVMGADAAYNLSTAFENTIIGKSAGQNTTDGERNTFIGFEAGLSNVGGSLNTAVGRRAMHGQSSNTACTIIGEEATAGWANRTNGTSLGFGTIISASNTVRIGNTAISQIGGYAGWTELSDARIKRNIRESVPGLQFVNALRPVSYQVDYDHVAKMIGEDSQFDASGRVTPKEQPDFIIAARNQKSRVRQSGLIAQEVSTLVEQQNIDFNGVYHPQNEGDLYGLNYSAFTIPLVKSVQELSTMIEDLQHELELLREKNTAQQAQIDALLLNKK